MLINEVHKDKILGSIFCYDRININATAGTFGYADGMTSFFYANGFKIFDFHKIFEPVTNDIVKNAEKIANDNNLEIEFVRKTKAFRKDDKIDAIIKNRGNHEGMVHIFSQLETHNSYSPWRDKTTGRCYFRNDSTKCLTYYFYFIDKFFGLCFLKVPTRAPFKCMFYFNGHNWLEKKLNARSINCTKVDNAFISIDDFTKAQEISNKIRVDDIHKVLDIFLKRYCPLPEKWQLKFNYTISQVEYALDIVFKNEKDLKPIYDNIIKTAMHTVTPDNVANFLGKRFSVLFEGEAGSRYNKRILGTRIKHQMGEVSVKVYDKFGSILRIEVTCVDVSKLKIFRDVHKKDNSIEKKVAPAPKSIYSLYPLISVFRNIITRYLEFISSFDDPTDGLSKIDKVTDDVVEKDRKFKGFNFFDKNDEKILTSIADGKYNISGITNKELRKQLDSKSSGQVSRILKRLRLHGMIKKVRKSYKYHLTSLGKQVISAGLNFKNRSLALEL